MKSTSRNRIGRALGRLGYSSLALQWTWAGVLVLPWLLQLDLVSDLVTPGSGDAVAPTGLDISLPMPVVVVIAVVSVIGAVAVTIWAIVRAPGEMTKAASRTTHSAASRGAKVFTHHKPVSKQKLFVLTERLVFAIKMTAVVLAVIVTWLAPATAGLDDSVVLFVASFLAGVSAIFFTAQRITTTADKSAL